MGRIDFALDDRQLARIVPIIEACREKATAKAALLIWTSGQLIASAGDPAGLDLTTLGTLAAAQISAGIEIARNVGEGRVRSLLIEGEDSSLHLTPVSEVAILVMAFGGEASAGTVRARGMRAAEDLQSLLAALEEDRMEEDGTTTGDLSLLGDITDEDVDRLFG